MTPMLSVSGEVHQRVRQLARFSGCDESEVIARLLERLDGEAGQDSSEGQPSSNRIRRGRYLAGRSPRERGAVVRIAGETVRVDSVRDLFEHVLKFVSKNGRREVLRPLLPFKTSARRYLIAEKPVHPNGNAFFVPVQHGGLVMEAHKSYRTAIADLQDLFGALKVPFEYISG